MKVGEVSVRRVCESRGSDVSCNFTNATGDGVTPETQTMMAEHAD